ncbi:hypothetical protein FOA52_015702 [Chlamydomonas sp. UWO 241]|nr:hypothetical protein FOA52_015702 [Chlamydomonas sp. UWO 241]
MQTRSQAHAAAHGVEALASPNLGASVLLNGLLFAHIWDHLDSDDKRQLRAVARVVRALADGLVTSLSMLGKSAADLASALAVWPNVRTLETYYDDDERSAVISAAPLSKLLVLVLEYQYPQGGPCGGARREWSAAPALSRTAAAGLQELHLADPYCHDRPVSGIKTLRDCSQLRKLSLHGCNISSLGPLAGCVHLELSTWGDGVFSDLAPLRGCSQQKKLWIPGSQVSDLAPLRGCVKLQDLKIRMCGVSSLEGLQACSQLKHVYMFSCDRVISLAPLSACVQLESLTMVLCSSVTSLSQLSTCCQLEFLLMQLCPSVTSLAPLSACTLLNTLRIDSCTSVFSVEPLIACTQLKELAIGRLAGQLHGLLELKAAMPRLRVLAEMQWV